MNWFLKLLLISKNLIKTLLTRLLNFCQFPQELAFQNETPYIMFSKKCKRIHLSNTIIVENSLIFCLGKWGLYYFIFSTADHSCDLSQSGDSVDSQCLSGELLLLESVCRGALTIEYIHLPLKFTKFCM